MDLGKYQYKYRSKHCSYQESTRSTAFYLFDHILTMSIVLPGALSCLSEVSSFRLAQLQASLLQEWLLNALLQDPLSFHSAKI